MPRSRSIAYEMLKNVLVPNGNGGQIHMHYLLLTQRGLLVADLLDLPGAVFGGDQMIEWTVIGKKRRYTFANPQHALYDRMAAVRLLTGDVPVEGRVLFTLRSEFPERQAALRHAHRRPRRRFPTGRQGARQHHCRVRRCLGQREEARRAESVGAER